MMRDYMRRHASVTPLFPRLPAELVCYLESEREQTDADPPWLLDLARYEWATREMVIDPIEISIDGIDPDGDLIAGVPALNPLARLLSYNYPVHRISPSYKPEEVSVTHLIVCRDRKDQSRYLIANEATARLFTLLKENPESSGLDLCSTLAAELSVPPDVVGAGARETLAGMHAADIILGAVRSSL